MKLFIILPCLLLLLFSCSNSSLAPDKIQISPSKNLKSSDLAFLLDSRKLAISRTSNLLSSPNTFDMIDGLNSQCDYMIPSYVKLIETTKGKGVFGSETDPRNYVENQITPAYREAQLAYEERLRKGEDGTAGKLDAPLARLVRLEELIELEVQYNTDDSSYSNWKRAWDALVQY